MFSWKVLWSTVLIFTGAWVKPLSTVSRDFLGISSDALEPNVTVPRFPDDLPPGGAADWLEPQPARTAGTPKVAAAPSSRLRREIGRRWTMMVPPCQDPQIPPNSL